MAKLDIDDLNMDKSKFSIRNCLPYCNTKFCLALFMKELGNRNGINTYALCPGTVNTPILNAFPKVLTPLWKPFSYTPNEVNIEQFKSV